MLLVSRPHLEFQLDFDGTKVRPRENVEVLGITYDSKLTFWTHTEQLGRTASRNFVAHGQSQA